MPESGNLYGVFIAVILVLPQLVVIWQNRTIHKKVVDVVETVNGQQAALNAASKQAQRAAGVAEGALAELRAERKNGGDK